QGVRGREPVDLEYLEKLLVLFSQLIAENPQIKECDINPLLAAPDQVIALDSRFSLYLANENRPELAIRPYPQEYTCRWQMKDSKDTLIRPILPEDERKLSAFHK